MKKYLSRMNATSLCPPRKPLNKILWSWLGSFLGILSISLFNKLFNFPIFDNLFLIGSFGASCVLIYGAPMVEFSQPRNLIGGHVLSACVGIVVYWALPDFISIASALAVSLSIVLMHVTRTLHPPGGATALIAVIGGAKVHELGFYYVLSPVFSGAMILLVIALIVNNMSENPKRQYPVYWY